jgi:hypothetical protein
MKTAHWAAAVLLAAGCTHASSPAAVFSPSPSATPAVTSSADATPGPTTTPTTAPTPSPTAVPHTRLRQVRPVTASGHLAAGYRITRHLRGGDCHDGSEAFGYGYRCFAGNEILDPCWRQATPATALAVLCLQDPYSHDVTQLRTSALEPLTGSPQPFGGASPWGLRLSDGETCLLDQGARDEDGGRVIDYECPRLRVLRGLHRGTRLWTADTVSWSKARAFRAGPTLTLTSAVYGEP